MEPSTNNSLSPIVCQRIRLLTETLDEAFASGAGVRLEAEGVAYRREEVLCHHSSYSNTEASTPRGAVSGALPFAQRQTALSAQRQRLTETFAIECHASRIALALKEGLSAAFAASQRLAPPPPEAK